MMGYAGGGIPSDLIEVTALDSRQCEFLPGLRPGGVLLTSGRYRPPQQLKPYSHWPDTIFCWVELVLLAALGGAFLWM